MGGVQPETCWASYKHGIINFDTLLHLVGYFCMNYTAMHGSKNIKHRFYHTVYVILKILIFYNFIKRNIKASWRWCRSTETGRSVCNIMLKKKVQLDATVCRHLFTAQSLYMFLVSQHPSSGVLKTVSATSGKGHAVKYRLKLTRVN